MTRNALTVELSDRRTISAPLAWYPRLSHATQAERAKWRLIGRGRRIHWPLLDEDISVQGLLAGGPSGESQESFKKWLDAREKQSPAAARRRASATGNGRGRGRKS